MTTLFVSYSGLLGGAERMLVDVASGLEGPVALACPEGRLAEHAREAGLRVLPVRERRLELRASRRDRVASAARVAGLARDVQEIAGALRPAVVFAWGPRAGMATVAALRTASARPKLVLADYDLLPGPLVAAAVRNAALLADRVVVPSELIARDIDPSGRLGDRLVRIRQGVDLHRFERAAQANGRPHALVLGAIVGWKQPQLALEAVALALRELPDLHLTVAGATIGPDGRGLADSLARRAERPDLAGRVTIAGELRDPVAALRASSCLLHCADCEPYGMVIVEAMASGLPVVAPNACGPPELVDESCARLYPPGDARAAADALVEVLGEPERAQRLGAAGRRRAERLFDLEQTRERFRALVAELAPRAPAARPSTASDGEGMAFLTVTHQSERDVGRLLDSIGRHLPAARVVVVDAGSTDGSARVAREHGAQVIEMDNRGFGAACNRGLEAIAEPVTIILNPDVELLDASLGVLCAEAARAEVPGRILAPLVLRPDGSREDSAQRAPTSFAAVAMALVPPGALPERVRSRLEPWRASRPRRADWPVGSCLAAATGALRRLGPFDERIFLYAEDLDLGLRARDAGIETWFWPEARVLHRGAHATEQAFGGEPFERLARARRAVVAARLGKRRAHLDDLVQAATFTNRIALKTALGKPTERERRQLSALRKARRERARLPLTRTGRAR